MDKLTGLRQVAREVFREALRAADPVEAVLRHLRLREGALCVGAVDYFLNQFSRIFVIGAGKAAARMALAVEQALGERVTGGLVITKTGQGQRLRKVQVREASHPVPDPAGVQATEELMEIARRAGEHDLVLCLISGGGSALLAAPAGKITLADLGAATGLLLNSGLSITEINTVRKHLSRVTGGRLAELVYPATLCALILSDVIADRLDVVASGPTVPDPTDFEDALAVLVRRNLFERMPASIQDYLTRGGRGEIADTPDRDSEVFKRVQNLIVGSNAMSLEAAEYTARRKGMNTLILSSTVAGEAREIAQFYLALAREVRQGRRPAPPPACLIAGGEPTVTVQGSGQGGRSQELALAVALGLEEIPGAVFLAAGTDGIDGPTDAAGAIAATDTLDRARRRALDPCGELLNNNSYPFFKTLDDLIITGPTGTNVMDVHLLLVG